MARAENNELDDIWKAWANGTPQLLGLAELGEEISYIIEETSSSYKNAIETLKGKYKVDRFEISAEVVVAQGENEAVVINHSPVIEAVFGVNLQNEEISFLAQVRAWAPDDPTKEQNVRKKVKVISTNKIDTGNPDALVISKKLASQLHLVTGDRIIISKIYQDLDKINLDTILDDPPDETSKPD